MNNSRDIRRRKKKKRNIKIVFFTFLLILIGGSSYFAFDLLYNTKQASDNIYKVLDRDETENKRTEEIKVSKEAFNVLLVGLEGQGGGARSDVVMLFTVNPKTEQVYVVSIPRDTRTYIPSLGYKTKISHSYGNIGIESTIDTVHELLDIPIDYYVTTNFQGFEDIVDTLGGIQVDVPFTFKAQLTKSLKWKTFQKGPMELNGNEALAYVRMRKTDPKGDMGRNQRQQQVLKAIVSKSTSIGSITKIDDLMEDLGENVKTNIPPSKFLDFINLYSKIKNAEINNLTLEGHDEWIESVYYYIPDEESINEINSVINHVLEGSETNLTKEAESSKNNYEQSASGEN